MLATLRRMRSAIRCEISLILAGDADVDRRGLPLVQGAADQAAGVERELQVVEPLLNGERLAELVGILVRALVPFLGQLDPNDRVHLAGVGRIGRRPVGRYADLRDDDLEVLWGNLLLDEGFDLIDPPVGDAQPCTAGGPDIDLEGAGVGLREELAADRQRQEQEHQGQQHVGDKTVGPRWMSTQSSSLPYPLIH